MAIVEVLLVSIEKIHHTLADNVGFLIWLATRAGEMNQIPRCERGTILFTRGYRLCPASRIIILRV